MERNMNGKGNREAATWDLRKTALFCLASRFCKLPESSAVGNQHWSCPESLLLLSWELVLEPLMELLCLVIFTSCDIESLISQVTRKPQIATHHRRTIIIAAFFPASLLLSSLRLHRFSTASLLLPCSVSNSLLLLHCLG
ncbi:uncharacterized protein DS421_12g370400 [Arachis hypogaea]|nr:uncharacterized protein DS421_12g370400 [Arachis hypogaea]